MLCLQTSAVHVNILIRSCLTKNHTHTPQSVSNPIVVSVLFLALTHTNCALSLAHTQNKLIHFPHAEFCHSHTHALSYSHMHVVFVLKRYRNLSCPQHCPFSDVMATVLAVSSFITVRCDKEVYTVYTVSVV